MKYGLAVGQQRGRSVELYQLALVQNQDLVVVEDSVQPVRDGQHAAIRKLFSNRRLENNCVSVQEVL